ncbi:MAG: hypothetical protein KDE66_00630 [Nitrosomonas sp.]|nr:hypothetical protein [Nitrosomonas sp.]MCB1975518.1 hypothetical protein [Nitrosomonas sp.]
MTNNLKPYDFFAAPQALSHSAMNFPFGTSTEYRHSKEQNIPDREIWLVQTWILINNFPNGK